MKKLFLLLILSLSITSIATAQQQQIKDLPLDQQVKQYEKFLVDLNAKAKSLVDSTKIRKETIGIVMRKLNIELMTVDMDAKSVLEMMQKQANEVTALLAEVNAKIKESLKKKPKEAAAKEPVVEKKKDK